MTTGRLEAFSDGVFAVAITLLVLNLNVPDRPVADLGHYLGEHWADYVAYVVSFITIGIVWINHHSMIARLARPDHTILILNVLLLMSVGVLPFATHVMAKYLTQSAGEHLAAGIYSGAFLLMALVFSVLNHTILMRRPQLLADPMGQEERRRVFRWAVSGVVPYVVSTALAPVSPYVTLALCGAIAVFYALPIASGR